MLEERRQREQRDFNVAMLVSYCLLKKKHTHLSSLLSVCVSARYHTGGWYVKCIKCLACTLQGVLGFLIQ